MDERLIAIVGAAREGRTLWALHALRDYVQEHPGDADGWAVLGQVAEDPRIRLSALRRAAAIDPQHPVARKALAAWDAPESPPPASPRVDLAAMRQARATLWPFVPKGEPERPLGALIDARRITRQDLQWAALEAREAPIREAAATLLAGDHHLPHAEMSREDARLISWPYRRSHRPLGRLVDEGAITAKELRNAAWHAEDPRLREAARVILRKMEPEATPLPPSEPSPPPEPPDTPPPPSGARPLLIYHGAGHREEQLPWDERQAYIKLTRRLRHDFDSDWALFLAVHPPQGKLLDGILLGPPGLFVLAVEVAAGSAPRRYRGDALYSWLVWWQRDRRQPLREALRAAEAIQELLSRRLGYTIPAEARLVWMPAASLDIVEPTVPVWCFETLTRDSAALRTRPPHLTAEQRAEIARLLREWQRT